MEPSAFPALGHRRVPSGGGFTSLHTVAARSGRLSDQIQAGNTASWVADHEVNSCSVCDVGFTLFLRKHHCRRCGHVVCDHCSKARLAVPPAYIQRVRVCDDCAKVLEDEDAAAAAACPGAAAGMLRVHTTPDQAQKSYDSIASIYALWSSYEAPHVAAGLDALGAAAGETVVEVGCGTGKAAAILARAANDAAASSALARGVVHALGHVAFFAPDLGFGVVLGARGDALAAHEVAALCERAVAADAGAALAELIVVRAAVVDKGVLLEHVMVVEHRNDETSLIIRPFPCEDCFGCED